MKTAKVFLISYTFILLLCASQGNAQAVAKPMYPLSVGDIMPDVLFTNVLNYKSSRVKLSDFKGKMVILDFWSSFCASCIDGFPHMDSLQQVFGNKLQVILVNGKSSITGDDSGRINKILGNVRRRTGAAIKNIPVVFDCPLLDSIIAYNYLPHLVWIDPGGRIAAITNPGEVTSDNIQSILAGKKVSLRLKKDIAYFDQSLSIFSLINQTGEDNLYYHSAITGYIEGLHGSGTRVPADNSHKITGYYSFNKTPEQLFRHAYSGTEKLAFHHNRVLLEIENPERFRPQSGNDVYRYSYCYDIRLPATTYDSMCRYMQQDLQRFFPFKIDNEDRELSCLILRSTRQLNISTAKDAGPDVELTETTVKKFLYNCSIEQVVNYLNQYSSFPVIAEMDYTGNVNIDLPFDLYDTSALTKALLKAGFDVKTEKRLLKVAVVRER